MKHIAIIGGGLAGLSAAARLSTTGARVTLLEAADRLGGQIHTETRNGYVVELGAEGFVARSEALPELAAFAGVGEELIGQAVDKSYGYRRGELHALAPGEAATFLGFQVPRSELGRGIKTFRAGMGSLVAALAKRLGEHVEIRRSTPVRSLDPVEAGLRLGLSDGASLSVDAAIVATSARAASSLLAPVFGDPARDLAQAQTLSSLTVSLAYHRSAVQHPLDATGFVVATEAQIHGFRACTFTTSKFEDRAPEDQVSLRLFYRPDPRELQMLTDAQWSARAETQLGQVLQVQGAAELAWVSRWPRALPVFTPEHRERVEGLEQALSETQIHLAGAAFHGSGIDAAVSSGARAARLLED